MDTTTDQKGNKIQDEVLEPVPEPVTEEIPPAPELMTEETPPSPETVSDKKAPKSAPKHKQRSNAKRNSGGAKPAAQPVASVAAAPQPSLLKDFLSLILKIAVIGLIFMLLFTFLFGFIRYGEPSMAPAIKDGDIVLFYRYNSSGYLPSDAIVLEFGGVTQVRRVIATAGDVVDIIDGALLINGAYQQEPSIYQQTNRYAEGVDFPLTVPEGSVFVLADSREGATDSRVYGCVSISDTLGKVMAVIRRRGI